MKKRLLSAVLAAALSMTALTAVPTAVTAENAPETAASEETAQTKNYWIFYKNIDTSEIDTIVSQKTHDYQYSLYDTVSDQREIEKMVTDYYKRIRLDMQKEAFGKKSAEILAELGVEPTNAFCSQFAPTIVCPLTDEQYEKAKKMDIITGVDVYEPVSVSEASDLKNILSTKEGIINECTLSETGEPLCDEHIKFDVQFNVGNETKTDYLVVYGLKSSKEISQVAKQLSQKHLWENPTMEVYSGVRYSSALSKGRERPLKAVFLVEDELLGWVTKVSVKTFSESAGFDTAPYIISLGDGNGDYKIDAVDASEALNLYSKVQTDNGGAYTAEQLKHLDVDKDGAVNALDASAILSYYAFTATGGEASLPDFLK